jgi:hypothetical protein
LRRLDRGEATCDGATTNACHANHLLLGHGPAFSRRRTEVWRSESDTPEDSIRKTQLGRVLLALPPRQKALNRLLAVFKSS